MSIDHECPYCEETRPTQSILAYHIAAAHPDVAPDGAIRMSTHPYPDQGPVCWCGDPIELRHESDPGEWIHSPGSNTPCLQAFPVNQPLVFQGEVKMFADTELLPDRADTVGARLEQAGRDIADLKRLLNGLIQRADTPNLAVVKQELIREIWCELMDAGHTGAARLVRMKLDSL